MAAVADETEGVGNRLCFWSGKIDSEGPSNRQMEITVTAPSLRHVSHFHTLGSMQLHLREKLGAG